MMNQKSVWVTLWGVLIFFVSACSVLEPEPLPTLVPALQLPEPTENASVETLGTDIIESEALETAVSSPATSLTPESISTELSSANIDTRGALVFINSAGEGLFLVRPDSATQTQYYALQNVDKLLPASFNGQRIGFIQEDRLFIARTDGSGLVEITAVSKPSWLLWSPVSDEFALIENGDLVVVQADSGTLRRLATGMALADIPGSVAWSHDGRQLLFTCGAQATDLCRVASDGSEAVVNITNNGPDSFAWYREPSWSPDDSQISFVSPDENKNLQLFVMHADGSDLRQLTFGSGQHSLHTWSPDGQQLAYTRLSDGSWQALVIDVDGMEHKEISAALPTIDSVVPRWDRDGEQVGLLYTTSALADAVSIALVSVEETAVTPITDSGWQLHWSPNGQQIAYIAADAQIFIQSTSGTASPRVISCQRGCESFAWLP